VERKVAVEDAPAYRIFRPDKPATALGLAVSYLMNKPAFAKLPFGEWSRILVGQINRRHYCFVIGGGKKIQGFAGWALTTQDKAEAWVEGRSALSYEDSLAGDCMVCNVWVAESPRIQRWMFQQARDIWAGKRTVYFKRFYPDGRIRPSRLNVGEVESIRGKRRAG